MIILSVLTLTTCHMYIGTVLRVMNHASSATRITIISNVTNIILNGIVLFIIPEYVGNPVLGVAVVTAFSRLLGCTFSFNCADTNFPSIQALLQAELEENISGFDIRYPNSR